MVALQHPKISVREDSIKLVVITCNNFETLESMEIAPMFNRNAIRDNIIGEPVCFPNSILLFFGYKGIVYEIIIQTRQVFLEPFDTDTEPYITYNWFINISNSTDNFKEIEIGIYDNFGVQSPKVPFKRIAQTIFGVTFEDIDCYI